MPATFDETLPTDKDRARAILGDTTMTDPLLTDAHISAVISLQGGLAAGVVFLAEELMARYARDPLRTTVEGVTVDYSANVALWRRVADRQQSTLSAAAASGLSFVTADYGAPATDEYARPWRLL